MDLSQQKLNKNEWNSVEISVNSNEKEVLDLIMKGFHNPDYQYLKNNTLLHYLKVSSNTDYMDKYLYGIYFEELLNTIVQKNNITDYNYEEPNISNKLKKINTPDLIKIKGRELKSIKKDDILEFEILGLITKIYKYYSIQNNRWIYYYYTLCNILLLDNSSVNSHVKDFATYIKNIFKPNVELDKIVFKCNDYIEKNVILTKYEPMKLYQHQQEIFSIFNKEDNKNIPKLVLYIAPTATGKTLTPIGLSEKYRIIFLCAARHVGVSLAKSAISAGKKVAFAFGCSSSEDIRLHYFAAKEYERHRKSGGIFKVDNSVGDNVEIMICDIKSYEYAMYYMLAFNNPNNIITFWDEPTITLDYEEHDFHKIIQENWNLNQIPNVILSSATLPKEHEIPRVINDFINKFENINDNVNPIIRTINSHECKKTIPILNSDGFAELPHYLFDKSRDLFRSLEHCNNYKTIMRYIDLEEIGKFANYVNENNYIINENLLLHNYFQDITDINIYKLKEYYFELLENIDHSQWDTIYRECHENRRIKMDNYGIRITTKDANSLSNGPTIFIAENVDKIAKFCLQDINIPKNEMEQIMNCINFNNTLNKKIEKEEKDLEDMMQKYEGSNKHGATTNAKEHKLSKTNFDKEPAIKKKMKHLDDLRSAIRTVSLDDKYIPNKLKHIHKWCNFDDLKYEPYSSNITEEDVEEIMAMDNVEDIWKVLLIMGIGLFSQTQPINYTEKVKLLAEQQSLYLIIANGDYIYGTNYQFCHGYLSKDLSNMTQEKIIQAMGRIGRNKLQQNYSVRFRSDIIRKIFMEEEDKIEVINMNNLFCSE